MCAHMWLEFQKEDGRWMSLKLLWAILFFSFCGVLWRTVLRNPGLGKWFCKDRVDWRTLLSVGSWASEMEYFSLITTGILKWCAAASVKIPWRQKNSYHSWCNKYCCHLQNIICSLVKCQCHWENIPLIPDIWLTHFNYCIICTYFFSQRRIFHKDRTRKFSALTIIILFFLCRKCAFLSLS